MKDVKQLIAQRAALELPKHSVINLGIGIPTLIADIIDERDYVLHTENGLLGVTKVNNQQIDLEIVNAGKIPVGEAAGAAYFSSADSFAMIRGGHVDIAVLGALQIDETGVMANWAIPGKDILGVGGAMDLLEGAKTIIATTTHTSANGDAKFVKKCTYPITSKRIVDTIVTDLAVFKWRDTIYELVDLVGTATLEEVQQRTEANYIISPNLL
ncbi:3-oxoacid CoA-transferase subunit B [Metasolibacillus sp. FSL H7-0170]|uniref:3-oxoacid CoA-transferase subunit B n=1 Tax=Metasolibacillus sp. FSL H7-0170 TaxID=2921431 RepID=UPI0007954F66|nr:succinyl-CoA--3-ketoacid-CoA transferase [[Bacillus] sp. KCTC 13219]